MRAEMKAPATLLDEPHPDLFRSAMRNLAGGVSIITAGRGDARCGLTATSVTSLSLEPPSLLVCIRRASPTLAAIAAHRAFGVNVLSADQRPLAERFAGQTGISGAARFRGGDWLTLETGSPLLANALAAVDCTLERLVEWSSHAIVIGRVRAIQVGAGTSPLVYWRGGYGEITPAGDDEHVADLRYLELCDLDNY
jgi:flavin reductase (DIM6/NTAB) family NADH-FMN oxidoreductase RutF